MHPAPRRCLSVEYCRLGTFQIYAGPQVGILLQDRYVIELDRGNEALQVNPAYARVSMPADMLELIGQYEYGLKYRIYEIVTDAVTHNRLSGQQRPAYIHDVDDIRTSGGTSSGAFAEGTRSGYLQAGEVIEATIEGIGTLRMPIVAGEPLPDDLSGSQLPPVSSYRDR